MVVDQLNNFIQIMICWLNNQVIENDLFIYLLL